MSGEVGEDTYIACPFCKSPDVFMAYGKNMHTHWVECRNCGATGPSEIAAAEARAAWNKAGIE